MQLDLSMALDRLTLHDLVEIVDPQMHLALEGIVVLTRVVQAVDHHRHQDHQALLEGQVHVAHQVEVLALLEEEVHVEEEEEDKSQDLQSIHFNF